MPIARQALLRRIAAVATLSSVLLPAVPLATAGRDEGSPLRAYLVDKRAAILAQSAKEAVPVSIHATVTAESRSGVRRLRIGRADQPQFQSLSDSGRDFAGYDLGAGSWDALVGTLASAVADEYVVQAALQEVPLDALDVVFTSIPERKSETLSYPNNLSYVAYIDSPATDAQLEALRQAVHAQSSVIDLVTRPQQVSHAEVDYVRTPAARDPGQPPGLRDFIREEKRPAILARQQRARSGGPAREPQPLTARAHVEPHTGLRRVFLGKDGYHQQLHDNAPELLGRGLAPTVEAHLLGVTGTCLTHIFEVQAATRDVLLDSLELTVDGELSPRFGRDVATPARYDAIRYRVRIGSPASEQEIDALRAAVEATCPLYNLVKDAQAIEGRIVRGGYTSAIH